MNIVGIQGSTWGKRPFFSIMNALGLHSAVLWNADVSAERYSRIHDSGATLFQDGKHIRSIDEARLSRIKYDGSWPHRSIDYVLGDLTREDIDLVVYAPSAVHICNQETANGEVSKYIKREFPNAKLWFVSHHLCHAASAALTAPFNSGSYLTLDGMGSATWDFAAGITKGFENNSLGYFDKEKGLLTNFTLKSGPGENSFGDYYMNMAVQTYDMAKASKIENDMFHYANKEDYEDVVMFSAEGKVMGLSAYGKETDKNPPYTYSNEFPLDVFGVDKYDYGASWINFHKYSDVFDYIRELGKDDAAYYVQKHYEDAIVKWITQLREDQYLTENVCFAGGCFLNVCANSLIKPLFDKTWIPPFPNDSGIHFGAAAYGSFKSKERIEMPANVALLGKSYDDYVPDDAEYYEDFDMLCEVVAKAIDDNKIIGWFQGRSEHGPRALGSRSILMSPKRAENKDIINQRVKHREYWRPFAGVILEDNIGEYFSEGYETPYMLFAQHSITDKLPAITHKDKSCRIQTVNDELNPRLCQLLRKFEDPVLLNTSFNDNGEPIVETPEDAIMGFKKMDIDLLVIGNYLLCN